MKIIKGSLAIFLAIGQLFVTSFAWDTLFMFEPSWCNFPIFLIEGLLFVFTMVFALAVCLE